MFQARLKRPNRARRKGKGGKGEKLKKKVGGSVTATGPPPPLYNIATMTTSSYFYDIYVCTNNTDDN